MRYEGDQKTRRTSTQEIWDKLRKHNEKAWCQNLNISEYSGWKHAQIQVDVVVAMAILQEVQYRYQDWQNIYKQLKA